MKIPDVAVVDYGVGNLLSVRRGLERAGAKVIVTADPKLIFSASRVVLPGVGAFANGMSALRKLGLDDVVQEVGLRGTPLLGICLGMQMLLDESDEFGSSVGLGLIPGRVIAVPSTTTTGQKQKIPHIGWNELALSEGHESWDNTILNDTKLSDAVYFVHSFMASPSNPQHRIADSIYGGHKISATIMRNNIVGCQFHPEKSGDIGLKILQRFLLL
jgi:glutamine amidotransferase